MSAGVVLPLSPASVLFPLPFILFNFQYFFLLYFGVCFGVLVLQMSLQFFLKLVALPTFLMRTLVFQILLPLCLFLQLSSLLFLVVKSTP